MVPAEAGILFDRPSDGSALHQECVSCDEYDAGIW